MHVKLRSWKPTWKLRLSESYMLERSLIIKVVFSLSAAEHCAKYAKQADLQC